MKKTKVERKMLGARVDARLIKALKFLALEKDKPVYALVEEGIRLVLRKYGQEVPEEEEETPKD